MLRHLVVSTQLLAVSLAVPQLLSCGDDAGTMLRLGQTIMGQPVGAASSTMRITFPVIYGSAEKVSSFVPGKVVPVEVTGVPTDVYFAIRLGDGGGELVMPTNGSTQMYERLFIFIKGVSIAQDRASPCMLSLITTTDGAMPYLSRVQFALLQCMLTWCTPDDVTPSKGSKVRGTALGVL